MPVDNAKRKLAKIIRDAMKRKYIKSQAEMARHFDVSLSTVQRWIGKDKDLSPMATVDPFGIEGRYLFAIADFVDWTCDELRFYLECREPEKQNSMSDSSTKINASNSYYLALTKLKKIIDTTLESNEENVKINLDLNYIQGILTTNGLTPERFICLCGLDEEEEEGQLIINILNSKKNIENLDSFSHQIIENAICRGLATVTGRSPAEELNDVLGSGNKF